MNILIVEDEIVVAMDIKKSLEILNYTVKGIASNYDDVLHIIQTSNINIDLVLMDINLENSSLDGIEIASKIEIPILYITAYSDNTTIQRAVQTNPLGYILKPFNEEELKANLELAKYKLTSPYMKVQHQKLTLGDGFYWDKEFEELFFNEIRINLGTYEKKLFMLLLDAKGNVVPLKTIESEVWGGNMVSDNTRRTLIYRLKTKLEHKFIETVPNVGCKLELQI